MYGEKMIRLELSWSLSRSYVGRERENPRNNSFRVTGASTISEPGTCWLQVRCIAVWGLSSPTCWYRVVVAPVLQFSYTTWEIV